MPWQDWVFSVGGFLVLASLLPTLRGDQKPALSTSLMTFFLVAIFAFTMSTLGLWLSAVANGGISVAWGVLALQRYHQTNRSAVVQIEEELSDMLPHDDDADAPDAAPALEARGTP